MIRSSLRIRSARYCASVVLQPGPAPPDGDRAQPEKPQRCTERPVAAVDGELRGPQQVGQAHLPVVGMAALAAERVRDPDAGAYASEHFLRHDLAAAGADQVQHAGLGHEHPLPPGLARHPHRGLVAAHHPACADGGLDGLCGGGQRRAGAGQDVVEPALADLQAEHLAHERAQPLSSDGGILVLREVEQRLGMADRLAACVTDPRDPQRVIHSIADIMRFRMLMIAA